jgi:hypothetical protein
MGQWEKTDVQPIASYFSYQFHGIEEISKADREQNPQWANDCQCSIGQRPTPPGVAEDELFDHAVAEENGEK